MRRSSPAPLPLLAPPAASGAAAERRRRGGGRVQGDDACGGDCRGRAGAPVALLRLAARVGVPLVARLCGVGAAGCPPLTGAATPLDDGGAGAEEEEASAALRVWWWCRGGFGAAAGVAAAPRQRARPSGPTALPPSLGEGLPLAGRCCAATRKGRAPPAVAPAPAAAAGVEGASSAPPVSEGGGSAASPGVPEQVRRLLHWSAGGCDDPPPAQASLAAARLTPEAAADPVERLRAESRVSSWCCVAAAARGGEGRPGAADSRHTAAAPAPVQRREAHDEELSAQVS